MRGGAPFQDTDAGLQQTIDFIFINFDKQIWMIKNENVTDNDEYVLPGTFGIAGLTDSEKVSKKAILKNCQNYVLTTDDAKKKIMYKNFKEKIGFNGSETDLKEIKDQRFYQVKYDKRTLGNDADAKFIIMTQVFTMPVKNTDLFDKAKGEWIDLNDANIFRGHKIILNDLKDELNKVSGDAVPGFPDEGGRRKRKSKKTKKYTKKTKKYKKKTRKHSGGKRRH